jgi:hypothetical protein
MINCKGVVDMLTEFQKRKLMKLFSMYDACNLGVLKISDFECLAERLADLRGWAVDSIPYDDISSKFIYLWNRMRSEIKNVYNSRPEVLNNPDAWNTQIRTQISLEEWFIYFDVVLGNKDYHEEVLALSSAIFTVVDTDESGHLDKEGRPPWDRVKVEKLKVIFWPLIFSYFFFFITAVLVLLLVYTIYYRLRGRNIYYM